MKTACLYRNDSDGCGAAYSLWKALKDQYELLFLEVQYGQEPPYEALRVFAPDQVYIVDFSYKADVLRPFLDEFPETMVIDHHKSSLEDLESAFAERVYKTFIHDERFSGCVLTWQHFFPDEDVPEVLLYVQDCDLWKFELENSKEINAYIASLPKDFNEWDQFYTPEAYDAGRAIIRLQKQAIERRLKDVRRVEVAGHMVPCVNASENISELGAAMCEAYPDAPFSVSYCDRGDGKRSYSLRSRNGFDVSEVAKKWSGGGHQASAGFTLPSPEVI